MVRPVGVSTGRPVATGLRNHAFIDVLLAESARVANTARTGKVQVVRTRSAFSVMPADIRGARI